MGGTQTICRGMIEQLHLIDVLTTFRAWVNTKSKSDLSYKITLPCLDKSKCPTSTKYQINNCYWRLVMHQTLCYFRNEWAQQLKWWCIIDMSQVAALRYIIKYIWIYIWTIYCRLVSFPWWEFLMKVMPHMGIWIWMKSGQTQVERWAMVRK